MLLVSQNLCNYEINYPKSTVLRFNLAWVDDLSTLEKAVSNLDNDIFLDLPVGRTKPPTNKYNLSDLKNIIEKNSNIKYLAISNVGSYEDIKEPSLLFSDYLSIVPKIETLKGLENISEICSRLVGEKIIMLDHDDLFSDLIKNNISSSKFFDYIEDLVYFCELKAVKLLKTRGVIFSDEDKYRFKR
jgi:hypothetical protein